VPPPALRALLSLPVAHQPAQMATILFRSWTKRGTICAARCCIVRKEKLARGFPFRSERTGPTAHLVDCCSRNTVGSAAWTFPPRLPIERGMRFLSLSKGHSSHCRASPRTPFVDSVRAADHPGVIVGSFEPKCRVAPFLDRGSLHRHTPKARATGTLHALPQRIWSRSSQGTNNLSELSKRPERGYSSCAASPRRGFERCRNSHRAASHSSRR
jgi:hypothetical protein